MSVLPESLRLLYSSHKIKSSRPAFCQISQVLRDVATHFSKVFIIYDALNEYGGGKTRLLSEKVFGSMLTAK